MNRFLLCMALILALPNAAFAADEKVSPVHPHEISGGLASSFFDGTQNQTPSAWTLDVAYHYRPQRPGFWQALRFTGGLRAGLASSNDKAFVFDVYARSELIANIGPWTPALGPELGVTTLASHFVRNNDPIQNDSTNLIEKKLSPVYLAIVATPLRFRFARFTVSALEMSVGAPVTGIGYIIRYQLGVLRFGGTF